MKSFIFLSNWIVKFIILVMIPFVFLACIIFLTVGIKTFNKIIIKEIIKVK